MPDFIGVRPADMPEVVSLEPENKALGHFRGELHLPFCNGAGGARKRDKNVMSARRPSFVFGR